MNATEERLTAAPLPTSRTLWIRSFVPYQLWRFAWLNLRMLRMAYKAH
ncbi:MAG TPA: hypothetical protein VF444_25265 [Pseudonocardiaceae bacterium]